MPLLHTSERDDLLVRLVEGWYRDSPHLSTLSDLPMLDVYTQALTKLGRLDDAKSGRNLIARIFENQYSKALRWLFKSPTSYPWGTEEQIAEYKLYLAALDELGRANDANRLRKAYPYLSR